MREVVVITGASGGVGRATARRFARDGAAIGLIARGEQGLHAAAEEVRAAGGLALVLPADVSDAEQVEEAARRVEEEFGPIDVWVNDAMATIYAELLDVEPDEYRRATEVTYLGTVWGTQAALRRMVPRDRGTIVQVGSALCFRGIPLQAPYCGAKHGVKGFTETARTELLHRRSRVHLTMVHLPGMDTPQFTWGRTKLPRQTQPVPPIYEPEVAADAVHWAAHHRRRQLYVGAPTVATILAEALAPGLVDRYLARTNYDAQMTDRPLDPEGHDNLFEPQDDLRDRGARGIFAGRSHDRSPLTWALERRGTLAAVAGLIALALIALRRVSGRCTSATEAP